jgi:hypothetical protein
MSILIKHNKKPEMPVCEMVCDKPLHNKLDKYEMTKYLNCHQSTLIIGKPQSGKTSFLYSLFKSKKLMKSVYNRIFLFQPQKSRNSMKDQLFEKGIPEDRKFDELTFENLVDVSNNLHEGCNVIIFDDMTAYLKDNEIQKKLKEMVMNRRHNHISLIFLVQTFKSVPLQVRKLFNNLIVFKCSVNEMKDIFEELVEGRKNEMLDVMKLVYDKPHQYLFINLDSQRMFKDFDELIFEDD